VGVGHGRWTPEEARANCFDEWLDAPVTMASLLTLNQQFDVIAHCAGNGSVSYSEANPRQDFAKTVESTIDVLEFIRLNNPGARLVYPSSAGVYGARPDAPIRETDELTPMSTYGYHKRIVEQLCENYSRKYGVRVGIVRFFSVYGEGLTKQLLWDASVRLSQGAPEAVFFGTGDETRDWIHMNDAAEIMRRLALSDHAFLVVNGATGNRVTVRGVLEMLRAALGSRTAIRFNGAERPGDPRFYHADVGRLRQLGIHAGLPLADGIARYAQWFRSSWSG
jgi:UDP-glucose 4-epimerase